MAALETGSIIGGLICDAPSLTQSGFSNIRQMGAGWLSGQLHVKSSEDSRLLRRDEQQKQQQHQQLSSALIHSHPHFVTVYELFAPQLYNSHHWLSSAALYVYISHSPTHLSYARACMHVCKHASLFLNGWLTLAHSFQSYGTFAATDHSKNVIQR